jgi:hypothetical protein
MCEEEKTYRVYNLLRKYFPHTLSLLDDTYDYSILDTRFNELLQQNAADVTRSRDANIVDFLLNCAQGDEFYLEFAKFLDGLVKDALDKLADKHILGLRHIVQGKLTNYNSLNYLNPFGEIVSLLTLLSNESFSLQEIEHPIPNGKSLDFFFTTKDRGSKIAVEVINLHPRNSYHNITELERHLRKKLEIKIREETRDIDFKSIDFTWAYLPVLWSTNLRGLLVYRSFFETLHNVTVQISCKEILILGFTSFVQVIDSVSGRRWFEYGYITKLFDSLR